MNALDDIQKVIDALRDKGSEMKSFEGLFAEISAALADILAALEKPRPEAKPSDYGPIVEAIKGLTLNAKMDAPAVTVNVPEQKAPVVNVTMPDKPRQKLSFKIKPKRGANGMAEEYVITEV